MTEDLTDVRLKDFVREQQIKKTSQRFKQPYSRVAE